MSKYKWEVTLDGSLHQIEFRLNDLTNKRSIFVNGTQIELPKVQRKIQWDTGTKHIFQVASHDAIIATRSSRFKFEPNLYIDKMNVDTNFAIDFEDQTEDQEEAIQARRKGVSIFYLVAGAVLLVVNIWMLLSLGRYFPFLAILGPALIVMAVYYMVFSEDPWGLPKPIPFRLILMFILAFGLGIANWWATKSGWYFYMFWSG